MHLKAILTRDDLHGVLMQFAPLEICLAENGKLLLSSPAEVALVPGKGMSVVCDATLQWPVLGFALPVQMRGLAVQVQPSVRSGPDGGNTVLALTLQIDRTGFSLLPAMIDERVTSRVNQELVKKDVELSWNFEKTLSHVFSLPDALTSAAALSLKVSGGTVVATDSAVVFTVDFDAAVRRRPAGTLDRRTA
jgi:hypothetical protein